MNLRKWNISGINGRTVMGLAAAICVPLAAQVITSFDYAADVSLALVMAAWWTLAWRKREFGNTLFAATASWLLSLSLSTISPLWLLGWIAVVPLYEAVERSRGWLEALLCGTGAGMVATVAGLDWVLQGFAHYTGSSSLAAVVFFVPFCVIGFWLLALWTALLYGFKVWRVPLWGGVVPAAAFAVADWIPLKPAPIYWGYSQWPWKSLIQIVDVSGMPVLAFLMAWSGFVTWRSTRWILKSQIGDGGHVGLQNRVRLFAPLAGVMVMVLLYGAWRMGVVTTALAREANPSIKVAAVQGNAPAFVPNDAMELKTDLAKQIVRLGAKAAESTGDVDLIVYAESTAPMGFRDGYNSIFRAAYQVVARNSGAHLLVDNVGYSSGTQSQPERFWREYLLLNPQGEIAGLYQKKRLVPVGESMPFEAKAPWLRKIFSIGTTFQPGTGPATVSMAPGNVRLAPLVCVEALHEDLARQAVREGADLLVSPSNDGWFRSGKQARQHLWGAGFRAVENRRPFIRVANTGYSAAVDAAGNVIDDVSPLGEPWTGVWNIKLTETGSLFTRLGHWFAALCGLIVAVAVLLALQPSNRQHPK